MYWTKDKFVFRDDESFGTLYRNLALRGSALYSSQLSSVVMPIKVTHCDRFGVNGFVDSAGTSWYSEHSYLFDTADRDLFKKAIPVVKEVKNLDVQKLLDCAHLLGRVYVDGKLVTKQGNLENYLRKQREVALKETEKTVNRLTKSLAEETENLKLLRGE